jgi:hypothetical protein
MIGTLPQTSPVPPHLAQVALDGELSSFNRSSVAGFVLLSEGSWLKAILHIGLDHRFGQTKPV